MSSDLICVHTGTPTVPNNSMPKLPLRKQKRFSLGKTQPSIHVRVVEWRESLRRLGPHSGKRLLLSLYTCDTLRFRTLLGCILHPFIYVRLLRLSHKPIILIRTLDAVSVDN